MATPSYDGYAWMKRNIKRYFRAVANPGAVDDVVIAEGITQGERMAHDEIMLSMVPWAVKAVTVDDVGGSLGTAYDYNARLLLIETDLGITDLARLRRLWRVSADQSTTPSLLGHIADETAHPGLADVNYMDCPTGESWTEFGADNASGNYEPGIIIFNWGQSLTGSRLKAEYWWCPPVVDPDWLDEVDANGNYTKGPPFPRPLWVPIQDYAKWCIAEITGDIDKQRALARRWKSKGGIQEMVREYLARFQTGEPQYVKDTFSVEDL